MNQVIRSLEKTLESLHGRRKMLETRGVDVQKNINMIESYLSDYCQWGAKSSRQA